MLLDKARELEFFTGTLKENTKKSTVSKVTLLAML